MIGCKHCLAGLLKAPPADPFWMSWTFDLFASRHWRCVILGPHPNAFPFLGTEGEPGASFPRLSLASVTTQGATHPPNSSLSGLCNPACLMHHRIRTTQAVKAKADLSVWEGSETKRMILWNLFNIFYFNSSHHWENKLPLMLSDCVVDFQWPVKGAISFGICNKHVFAQSPPKMNIYFIY